MFVEDCNRHREYIHLLSFNYDFHLCKAQFYLKGSQIIFNKGYGVTHMLKGLLQEYVNSPVFARNRLGYGKALISFSFSLVTPQSLVGWLHHATHCLLRDKTNQGVALLNPFTLESDQY